MSFDISRLQADESRFRGTAFHKIIAGKVCEMWSAKNMSTYTAMKIALLFVDITTVVRPSCEGGKHEAEMYVWGG